MSVSVRLPDVEHWNAQVTCQAACPAVVWICVPGAAARHRRPIAAAGYVILSLVAWIAVPATLAMRRLEESDIA
jgi:hypothetical protein